VVKGKVEDEREEEGAIRTSRGIKGKETSGAERESLPRSIREKVEEEKMRLTHTLVCL